MRVLNFLRPVVLEVWMVFLALLGDFLQDSQVSFLDKPACGAGVLIGVNITSLQSVIPLSMFGIALVDRKGASPFF